MQLKHQQPEWFFRPFRAVLVISLVFSTALVATVTGGVLQSSMRITLTVVTSTTVTATLTEATITRVLGSLFG